MRRCLFLLSAAAAIVVATAPVSSANPICAAAWTVNPTIQTDEPVCVDYPYGAQCEWWDVWHEGHEVYLRYCLPVLI